MGLRMKKFDILSVYLKIRLLGGEGGEGGGENCLKRGSWTLCRFKGGRVDTAMHTMDTRKFCLHLDLAFALYSPAAC